MSRTLDVRRRILEDNDRQAAALRASFKTGGTLVVNMISSPGSGKTALLEATARDLAGRYAMAALEGDIETERDAERLRARGLRAYQILTGGSCHLDARLVARGLEDAAFPALDILFIENVGNLICPTSYDLGEDFKIALLSTAEGDDKPFKYPAIFARAGAVVITKADLGPHVSFDMDVVRGQIETLNPGAPLLVTSARTGDGLEAWYGLLAERLEAKRRHRA
jgi:hydrogenase nickel incorporation protein HypB